MGWTDKQELVILDDDECIMFSSVPFYVGRAFVDWKDELNSNGTLCRSMSDVTHEQWTYVEVWWCFHDWEKRWHRSCSAHFFPEVVSEGYVALARTRKPRRSDKIKVKAGRLQSHPADYTYRFIFFDLLRFAL